MLPQVPLQKKKIKDYQELISDNLYQEIITLAKKLKNLRVVHINATSLGGGVAEILRTLVPLMLEAGLKAKWYTLPPDERFFRITKKIHNLLQGKQDVLAGDEKRIYLDTNKEIAESIKNIKADIWVIHDPQPLPLISYLPDSISSILRLHIDLSNPQKETWDFLLPYIKKYNRVIFSVEDFANKSISKNKIEIFTPAIDPLTDKNKPLNPEYAKGIIQNFEINTDKPLIAQISRFDIWKDPLGVIGAYYLAKKEIPDLQLALVGIFQAQDDPEAIEVFERVKKHAKGDPDIFLFSNLEKPNIENDILVNTIQVASDVILQKSIKEGFGLTVTEAMWKEKPVIGGNVGGIKLQIKNNENGFLVNSPKEAAKRIVQLIKNPELAKKFGKKAQKTVKEKFLIPRLLRDYLRLFADLLGD